MMSSKDGVDPKFGIGGVCSLRIMVDFGRFSLLLYRGALHADNDCSIESCHSLVVEGYPFNELKCTRNID